MDVSLASVLVFLHVVAAVEFIAGLIGRSVVLARARHGTDIDTVDALVAAAGPFERMVVIGSIAVLAFGLLAMWARHVPFVEDGFWWLPVSLLVFLSMIPLVPLVFVPKGKVFEAALEDARARGEVTPELGAASGIRPSRSRDATRPRRSP